MPHYFHIEELLPYGGQVRWFVEADRAEGSANNTVPHIILRFISCNHWATGAIEPTDLQFHLPEWVIEQAKWEAIQRLSLTDINTATFEVIPYTPSNGPDTTAPVIAQASTGITHKIHHLHPASSQ